MSSAQTPVVDRSSRASKWDLSRSAIDPGGDVTAPYIAANEDSSDFNRREPMWLFVADGIRVLCKRPVDVEILEENGDVIAACKRLHVFASGASYEEAISSLHEQIVHFCLEYQSLGPDDVIGRAVEIRDLYTQQFEVEQ